MSAEARVERSPKSIPELVKITAPMRSAQSTRAIGQTSRSRRKKNFHSTVTGVCQKAHFEKVIILEITPVPSTASPRCDGPTNSNSTPAKFLHQPENALANF